MMQFDAVTDSFCAMAAKRSKIQMLVEKGEFIPALELAQRLEKRRPLTTQELSWKIGAQSFRGIHGELEASIASFKKSPKEDLNRAIFFQLLLNTRLSYYKKARQQLRLLRKSHNSFFAHQGLGFFSFFEGLFDQARNEALSAHKLAKTDYERFLSLDLLGHCLIQQGQTLEGISFLEQAYQLAINKGQEAQAQATNASILSAKIEYGIDLEQALKQADSYIADPKSQDFYTLSSLLINRSRSFILQGNLQKAEELARMAALTLYKTQNKRQTILLNLLLARLAAIEQDYLKAFNLVETSLKLCDPDVDRVYLIKCFGIKKDLVQDLQAHPWAKSLQIFEFEKELKGLEDQQRKLCRKTNHYLSIRHEYRRLNLSAQDFQQSGKEWDPLGDLLLQLKVLETDADPVKESKLAQEFIKKRLYGLIPRLPTLNGHQKFITVDWPTGYFICANKGHVHVETVKLTPLMKNLLILLSHGYTSKQECVEKLYGYTYDPLIHDPLIYALISRLRKIMGPHAYFIELTEEGYQLAQDIHLIRQNEYPLRKKQDVTLEGQSTKSELNSRQVDLLQQLKDPKNREITPAQYKEIFQVSRITATRDLKTLCDFGHLKAYGKARGIKYRLFTQDIDS